MKVEAISQETRLLCRNRIDTVEQLLSYKGSLETEMAELTEQRKGPLFSIPQIRRGRKRSGQSSAYGNHRENESLAEGDQIVRGYRSP